MAAFESRSVDPVRIAECKERLALLFERGLKSLPLDVTKWSSWGTMCCDRAFLGCRLTSVSLRTWSVKRNCWLQDLDLTLMWREFWLWLVAVVTSTRQHVSEVETAPWQVYSFLRRNWPKNIFPPSWESSSAVYQVLFHQTNAVRCRLLFQR